MTDQLHLDICRTADRFWPQRDLPSRLRKLGEELGELHEALLRFKLDEAELEIADVAIVLSDLLYVMGRRSSLLDVMECKWNMNKEKWKRDGKL